MRLLLERGADVNAPDREGRTALLLAAREAQRNQEGQQAQEETVRALLDRKADVNARTKSGYTALILAAMEGRAEIVRLLLAKGADVSARTTDQNKMTALGAATGGKHTEVVGLLIAAGAKE